MKTFILSCIAVAAVSAQAVDLDDFEHNNPALYTLVGGTGSIVTP